MTATTDPYSAYDTKMQQVAGLEGLSGLIGGIFRRKAYADSEAYNRSIYQYNIAAKKKQGDELRKQGVTDMQDAHLKGRLVAGDVRADAAARGVDVNSGSAQDISRSVDSANATNENRIVHNAFTAARQQYEEATALRMQQELERKRTEQLQSENNAAMFKSAFTAVDNYGAIKSLFTGFFGG